MQFALIIAGTMLGLLVAALIGADSPQWLGALLGASVGYAIAQFHALRTQSKALETEVRALKERLADVLRRLQVAETAGRTVGAGDDAAKSARGPGTWAATARDRALGGGAPEAAFQRTPAGPGLA